MKLYPEVIGSLLKYACEKECALTKSIDNILVITDQLPIRSKRAAIIKAVKTTLKSMLPEVVPYKIHHHDSKAHTMLQVADYCNWAIYKKWEDGSEEFFDEISRSVRSELKIY